MSEQPTFEAKSDFQENRRAFLKTSAAAAFTVAATPGSLFANDTKPFSLNYIVGSCMYGYTSVAEILPEVKKTGATAIDIWPKVHGNQREQLDEMGEEKFADLLKQHGVKLGCITQYKLGPFGLQKEMQLAKRSVAKRWSPAVKVRRASKETTSKKRSVISVRR